MILRKLIFGLGACAFAASSLVPQNAEAIFASVKNAGLANLGVALPLDAMAPAYNPAGATEVGDRIDVQAGWSHYSGKGRIRGNALPSNNRTDDAYNHSNYFPFALGINKTFCDCTWAVGLVAYEHDFAASSFKSAQALLGTKPLKFEYLRYTIAPNVAYRLNSCHSFGASLNIEIQAIKLQGVENFDNALFSSSPGNVTDNGRRFTCGVSGSFGWLWNITDSIKFGAMYITPGYSNKFKRYRGFLADHGRFNTPQAATAGFSWNPICPLILSLDVYWVDWRSIRELRNNLLAINEHRLGDKHGTGLDWRNQTFIRFGAQYAVNDCLTLRIGYRYAETPVRRTQTAINQLPMNCAEHFLTGGATYAYNECNEFSFFIAEGFDKKIRGKNSIPLYVTPGGAPVIVPLGGGNVDINEQQFALGVSWGMRY